MGNYIFASLALALSAFAVDVTRETAPTIQSATSKLPRPPDAPICWDCIYGAGVRRTDPRPGARCGGSTRYFMSHQVAISLRPEFQNDYDFKDPISRTCVANAMRGRGPASGKYLRCNAQGRLVERLSQPSCVTARAAYNTTQAYNLVMNCFGLSPRVYFQMFNQESNFHNNVLGPGDDVGIGQTKHWAGGEFRNHYDFFANSIKSSGHPACKAIKKYVIPKNLTPGLKTNLCFRAAAYVSDEKGGRFEEGNPISNLIYAASFIRVNRTYVNNRFRSWGYGSFKNVLLKHFKVGEFNAGRYEAIVDALGYHYGLSKFTTLEGILRREYKNFRGTLTPAHFANIIRRIDTHGYVAQMMDKSRWITKRGGEQCTAPFYDTLL